MSVSSGMTELQPLASQSRKHQGEGRGGGGGGRPLHGAKMDFDAWKAKAEENNQRCYLVYCCVWAPSGWVFEVCALVANAHVHAWSSTHAQIHTHSHLQFLVLVWYCLLNKDRR